MAYYTYILRCADGSLYTGITTELARRFAEHAGLRGRGAKYTATHPPVRFEAAWSAPGRAEASRLEAAIKALSRAEKERLLRGAAPARLDMTQYHRLSITDTGEISMQFICYPKCSTCKKAQAFLDARGAAYTLRDIQQDNPTETELRAWLEKSGLPLRRFFNTSGVQYRALGLSRKLPDLSTEAQLALLATDGMLLKRPLLVSESFVLVGFRQEEWEAAL